MPDAKKQPAFGQRLRTLREAAGLSLSQLAAKAAIPKSYLWDIETGRRPATWELVCRLADGIGVGVEELR